MDGGGFGVKPGRLNVGIVGAGKVGAVWGAALALAGHRVVAASGASEASISRIDTLLPGVERLDPDAVVLRSDLVVIAVPDDDVQALVTGLASVGAWRAGQIAVHASGRHGLAVMGAAEAAGVTCLAIHPAMTFTGTSLDLARMRDAVFAVTARAPFIPIAQALAVELGGEPMVIAEEDRPLYHAALVHAANHGAVIVAQAMSLLVAAGVEEPGRVLGPLVRASLEGVLADSPGDIRSLTGPVVRGDAGSVASHVLALDRYPDALATYRAMAGAAALKALDTGRISSAQYAGLMEALGGAE